MVRSRSRLRLRRRVDVWEAVKGAKKVFTGAAKAVRHIGWPAVTRGGVRAWRGKRQLRRGLNREKATDEARP